MYLFLIAGVILVLFILLPLGAVKLFNGVSLSKKAKRIILGTLAATTVSITEKARRERQNRNKSRRRRCRFRDSSYPA